MGAIAVGDKITIMVAEDIDLIREDLVEELNEQAEFSVIGEATTGKEIVDLVSANPPDIVLMDIEMEDLHSGIRATEQINDLNLATKIIYLTAHETREIVLTAMATGAVDYIVKNGDYPTIFRHIRAVMANQSLMAGVASNIILEEYQRLKKTEKNLVYFINNISQLTVSEREIIGLLLKGLKISQIAKERSVEVVTVKTQITSILRKFGERRTKEIVKMIRDLNLEHLF